MSVHQVITGALNKGENVYAIGSVEGITFTVCAVGSDVVILDSDFTRVQVVPGCSHHTEQLVTSVSCCPDSGKIAATYGDIIRVFEPMTLNVEKKHEGETNFPFKWLETQCFTVKGCVNTVLWNMDGLRMLVVINNELFLYQHRSVAGFLARPASSTGVMFCIAEEDQSKNSSSWDLVWTTTLSYPPKYIKYSPDGAYFAVSGENDFLVKVYYQDVNDIDAKDQLNFEFVTLHHPAAVRGFEWRRTGRYMPRKGISAVLISWCEDNTSRIWKETPAPELAVIDITGDGGEPAWEHNKPRKLFGKQVRVKTARKKIMTKLRGLVSEKKRKVEDKDHGIGLRAQIGRTPSMTELHNVHNSCNNVQFHLAGTINAETDCLLVPSMDSGSMLKKPFCVHWLNNKELVFSLGAERLLAETILTEGDGSSRGIMSGSTAVSPADHDTEDVIIATPPNGDRPERPLSAFGGSVCSESPSSKDILDVKLEILLRQWSKSTDILFTIHPVDGSLLVWTVEMLDDVHRQPVISFTSRFPGAFPITDASSLHPTLNTFNPHEPLYVDVLRHELEHRDLSSERIVEKAGFTNPANTIHVLTNHENGSLNLWHMAMQENSNFTSILNITHISRMCGHRFQIKQVVAHPVLPLLLTTSQFRSEELKETPSLAALSEVILWKISPVGPLCKSGGVIELARVANPSRRAFSSLSWIPTILPSCTLGTVCNSPSSCFISSDGSDLVIHQAVIDARGLLSEIYESNKVFHAEDDSISRRSLSPSPRHVPNGLLQQFKVVSTQSTAKPGCVLELGKIKDVVNTSDDILLLHVFNERLVIEEEETTHDETNSRLGVVVDRSHSSTFRDRFFVVVVEKGEEHDSFVMYSLVISSQQPQPIPHYDIEDLPDEKGFLRPASPLAHSVAKLHFQTELVCRQQIPLPSGCRLVSAAPAAGHLPSSTIYPACQAPFVLLTSGTDDVVRFWRCSSSSRGIADKFTWSEWNMVGDGRASDLEVEGSIFSVSAAHSGRIACAYDPRCGAVLAHASEVEIGVFECESSGGVEWMREDTLHIRDIHIPNTGRTPLFSSSPHGGSSQDLSTSTRIGTNPSDDLLRAMARPVTIKLDLASLNLSDKIRLDWVSTEDGAHILTAGVAAKIYLYTQVSQDPAQQNVVLMKESETTLRRPSLRKMSSFVSHHHPNSTLTKWVCTRVLALESADGLPPIPTTLSWARDGLLVVGMQSEMRVYNQWNLQPNTENKEASDSRMNKRGSAQTPTVTISASYSMLDQLHKKKELTTSKSRLRIDLMNKVHQQKEVTPHAVLEAISGEGLFEAARLSSPILPQYHPKQLIVLLNAGKTKRVKAILLHVLNALKQHQGSMHNPLSRAASLRRMSTVDDEPPFGNIDQPRSINLEEDSPDYNEIDDIAPLPLFALMTADNATATESGEKAEAFSGNPGYDSLFEADNLNDEDLDEMLKDNDSAGGRSRHASGTSDIVKSENTVSVIFTAKHNRALTELLTHTHLPGLSSVDQMHLLAIADTLSHFSGDVMDKLAQANAAMQPVVQSVLGESSAAGGYATATAGVETVDECGLRFLMSMKQHEYLLLCLPPKQRVELKKTGLSSANIIWAQHSETETELLNAVPFMQKANPLWDDFRTLGVAWWLKNTASLRICIEKLAKAAFQQNQDPMDASLFYLAMRKKNVLTHLFKTSRNQMMADFFSNDFNNDHWKKVAAKNAFVLMSKQRFQHAAAFFLLSGSLKDAVQTIIRNCNDLQLAMVVVRLYETDVEAQQNFLKELLCREVLGVSPDEFDASRGRTEDDFGLSREGKRDPFERSMAYWFLKDYTRAAHTLVEEAHGDRLSSNTCLSDIFNFYSFLRKHPLVVRQRLSDAGAQVGSTEKFIALGKQLETLVTPPERRLFFRTAAEHMARGCPMLALEVLSRLPKNMLMIKDSDDALRILLGGVNEPAAAAPVAKAEDMDWSEPTNVVKEDDLDLGWSDDDEDVDEFGEKIEKKEEALVSPTIELPDSDTINDRQNSLEAFAGSVDVISQHLKFVASLRILTEELSTLASGYEVDGGQLRYQLFTWLEKEVEVLKQMCDYRSTTEVDDFEEDIETFAATGNSQSLHDALKSDHAEMVNRLKIASRRRKWLVSNQKLLRSFTSYCALHCGQNHRLTSALMELLLLLLEIQKDSGIQHLSEAVPDINSFPLLEASVSSTKMFVSSPLSFIENQCHDLLVSIANLTSVPSPENHLQKAYVLYNLCQGLSSCLYQSLCDVDQFNIPIFLGNENKAGALTRRSRFASTCEDIRISTSPNKWPGLDNLVALMGREKDDNGPDLRILLAECYVSIVMSLFCFAIAAHDARWLYRLASHDINETRFGLIFGGGGHKKLKAMPPTRPPRPAAPRPIQDASENYAAESPAATPDAIRSKFHTKILGPAAVNAQAVGERVSEQTILRWVPPHKNIVQMFAEKPPIDSNDKLGVDFDSDDESDEDSNDSFEEDERCEAAQVSSYAWLLMRLALVEQQMYKLKQFLTLAGFDISEIPSNAPRLDAVLRLLANWSSQLRQSLRSYPGGCPVDIIPNTSLDSTDGHMTPTARKYASLLEKGNTPFETDDSRILPIKRLWAFLVRENHLQNLFIVNIYSSQGQQETPNIRNDSLANNIENQCIPEAFKIIQKDSEPIVAFACHQEKPGLIVVSNGRELQEMDLSSVFEDKENSTSWLYNRTDLDMQLISMKKDTFKDNDDYQLFTDSSQNGKQTSMLLKRTGVGGIRRIDSHPSEPYYVTGSTDGSIRVWEWGIGQAIYTARVAGQHAKVAKITFSCNGNKFAAVDGDGMLCLWQATRATDQKKPFFSQRCHNKSATDVRFLGHSSSVLITAGASTGEYNLGLWDTLLPQNKALVHSWVAHTEGATCAMYLPTHQTIVSGGRHGDICLWDVRQRQLRATVKAFEPNQIVKCLVTDLSQDLIVAGSSEGDIKIWSADGNPQLMYSLAGEHTTRGGFSFRQVGQSSVQGVQQLYIDQHMRLFSCGADATLKFRTLPSVYNLNI